MVLQLAAVEEDRPAAGAGDVNGGAVGEHRRLGGEAHRAGGQCGAAHPQVAVRLVVVGAQQVGAKAKGALAAALELLRVGQRSGHQWLRVQRRRC